MISVASDEGSTKACDFLPTEVLDLEVTIIAEQGAISRTKVEVR